MRKRSRNWSKTKTMVRVSLYFYLFYVWLTKGRKRLAKSQLTKANQNKTRFENVARELQKVHTSYA